MASFVEVLPTLPVIAMMREGSLRSPAPASSVRAATMKKRASIRIADSHATRRAAAQGREALGAVGRDVVVVDEKLDRVHKGFGERLRGVTRALRLKRIEKDEKTRCISG